MIEFRNIGKDIKIFFKEVKAFLVKKNGNLIKKKIYLKKI